MKNELTVRIALATRGSRDIGRTAALALARARADVAVMFQQESQTQKVCAEVEATGRRALLVKAGISKAAVVALVTDGNLLTFETVSGETFNLRPQDY